MIGKIVRMKRHSRAAAGRSAGPARIGDVRRSVYALTRYIADANPHGLMAQSAAHDILSLSEYALAVQSAGIEPGEKVSALGTRNLFGETLPEWQAEMLAVAAQAPAVKTPVVHIILSLHEHESWTEEEREEAITITLQTLRLDQCQVVWAEHSNTKNPHLHLSVVRVDPISWRAAGTEWLIDDLHQALALIEERQGRVREPDALYIARDGVVFDAESGIMVRDKAGKFIAGWYKELGRKHSRLSAEFLSLRAELIAAAAEAGTWEEFHDALAPREIRYDKSGSGARIKFAGKSVKASEVHASLSRPELEKTLGPFEPDACRIDLAYEAYRSAFDQQLAALREQRSAETDRLSRWRKSNVEKLADQDAAIKATIDAEAVHAKAELQKAFAAAIKLCTDQRLTEEKWRARGRPARPEAVDVPALILPSELDCREQSWQPAVAFDAVHKDWGTEYRDHDGHVAFSDHRNIIIVHATRNHEAIDEALRIAAERWGTVRITGPAHFVELAAARAQTAGINAIGADGERLVARQLDRQVAPETPIAGREQFAKKIEWTAPDLAQDVARNKRINEAIQFFTELGSLPLRRQAMPDDTAVTGRSGLLEIVIDDNDRNGVGAHAIFDQDPRVQECLEKIRENMLESWRIDLLIRQGGPIPDGPEAVRQLISNDYDSRRLSTFAEQDCDFREMTNGVRQFRAECLKAQPRSVPPADPVDVRPASQAPVQQAEPVVPEPELKGNDVFPPPWMEDKGKGRWD